MQAAAWFRPLLLFFLLTAGCGPDDHPLKSENESLRKQTARQESMILSLQDGNKVMQQQIDLLNRELREAKQLTERAETDRKALAGKFETAAVENRKLTQEAKRIVARQAQITQLLRVSDKTGQFEELSQPVAAVAKAAEEALSRNGYDVRVSLRTDQRAVYVTERKVSPPASLEQSGFRNQYLISIQVLPSGATRLLVRAEFEKLAQGNRVLAVGTEETAELERRLITEIGKVLASSGKV